MEFRRIIRQTTWMWAVMLGLALAAGCASTGPPVPPSGFLENYKALKPDPQVKGLYWWEKRGVDWKEYNKLLIDPVQVRVDKSKSKRRLQPGEAKMLAAKLRQAVVKALESYYPVVDKPGPGVLRLRAALVHVKPVNPAMNVMSTAIMMMPMDVGEAAVESQFMDSMSSQVLAEVLVVDEGSHSELTKVWSRWDQVEDAFRDWAQMLKESFRETK